MTRRYTSVHNRRARWIKRQQQYRSLRAKTGGREPAAAALCFSRASCNPACPVVGVARTGLTAPAECFTPAKRPVPF
jgi:hypothetical protein